MSDQVENLKLLIKFLGMTRSANNAEALVAMRKANEHLDKTKATWEEILMGKVKITIVEDPFKNAPVPPPPSAPSPSHRGSHSIYNTPRPAPRPSPQPPPWPQRPTPQKQPPPQYDPFVAKPTPAGTTSRVNQYPGVCHKCGTRVAGGAGLLDGKTASGQYRIVCAPGQCKTSKYGKTNISADDLANMV